MASTTSAFPDVSFAATTASSAPTSTWTTMFNSLNGQPAPNLHIGRTIAINIFILLVTTLCFSLRIYVRHVLIREIGLDDYLLMASYGAFVVLVALFLAILVNLQIHGMVPQFLMSFELGQIWYLITGLTAVLVRASIASFFLRIIPRHGFHRAQRLTIIIASWLYSIFMVVGVFLVLFQCGADITGTNPDDVCMDPNVLEHMIDTMLTSTCIVDWLMVVVPMLVVWRCAMPLRAKMLAMGVLMLGALGSVVSIIRIPFNDLGFVDGPVDFGHYITWLLLAFLETSMGIIAISLAALRPLFKKVFKDETPLLECGQPAVMVGLDPSQNKNVMFLGQFQVDELSHVESKPDC